MKIKRNIIIVSKEIDTNVKKIENLKILRKMVMLYNISSRLAQTFLLMSITSHLFN